MSKNSVATKRSNGTKWECKITKSLVSYAKLKHWPCSYSILFTNLTSWKYARRVKQLFAVGSLLVRKLMWSALLRMMIQKLLLFPLEMVPTMFPWSKKLILVLASMVMRVWVLFNLVTLHLASLDSCGDFLCIMVDLTIYEMQNLYFTFSTKILY